VGRARLGGSHLHHIVAGIGTRNRNRTAGSLRLGSGRFSRDYFIDRRLEKRESRIAKLS
jgi:hypothetical protein